MIWKIELGLFIIGMMGLAVWGGYMIAPEKEPACWLEAKETSGIHLSYEPPNE